MHVFPCSTAPHTQQRRPAMDLANIPSMPANPNFTRNTPARSTYAYGTRRPPQQTFSQQYTPTGGASASQPAPGGGFFKRLIPVRFSKRNRWVCHYSNITNMIHKLCGYGWFMSRNEVYVFVSTVVYCGTFVIIQILLSPII